MYQAKTMVTFSHRGPLPRPPPLPPVPLHVHRLGLAQVLHVAAGLRHLVPAGRVVWAHPLGRGRLPLAGVDQLSGVRADAAHGASLDALFKDQERGIVKDEEDSL